MKTNLIRTFLDGRRQPLAASAETARLLDELCRQAPEFCAQVLADATTHGTQKAQLLAGLVGSDVDRQQIAQALRQLSDTELLQVLDGLRQRRVNGRRARELGLRVLLAHEQFAELAATHRLRLVRLLKHLLGEQTWSSVRRSLEIRSPEGDRFLHRVVLRFAADAEKAREVLCFLAGLGFDAPEPTRRPWIVVPWLKKPEPTKFELRDPALRQSAAARRSLEAGEGMPRETLFGIRGTYHRQAPSKLVRRLSAPQPRQGRLDGALTAALKEVLTGGNGAVSFADVVAKTDTGRTTTVDLSASVVLDLSGSAMSSGERLYHPAALGLALVGLLEQCVERVTVFQVGGSASLDDRRLPRPQGSTDLATAVLQAARTTPEAILVVTDGYENFRQGDVAQVVEGLRRLGLGTTVYQVVPVFTAAEDLSRRRLGESIPVVPVDHESTVGELTARLLLAKEPEELSSTTLRSVEDLLFGGVQ
jgi:hypothetical protein